MSIAVRKRETFVGELFAGLMLSVVGAGIAAVLAVFVAQPTALKLTVAVLAGAYLVLGLRSSSASAGRLLAACTWLVGAAAVWFAPIGLPAYVATHAALACCSRAVFRYTSPVSALADFCLTVLAALAGGAAALATGSVFLACWCFFLPRALHVSIPVNLAAEGRNSRTDNTAFDEAHRAAKTALDALASRK